MSSTEIASKRNVRVIEYKRIPQDYDLFAFVAYFLFLFCFVLSKPIRILVFHSSQIKVLLRCAADQESINFQRQQHSVTVGNEYNFFLFILFFSGRFVIDM